MKGTKKQQVVTADAVEAVGFVIPTQVKRISSALQLMLADKPSVKHICSYLDGSDVDSLQAWVLAHDLPCAWASGIGVIDAALALANSPREDWPLADDPGKRRRDAAPADAMLELLRANLSVDVVTGGFTNPNNRELKVKFAGADVCSASFDVCAQPKYDG